MISGVDGRSKAQLAGGLVGSSRGKNRRYRVACIQHSATTAAAIHVNDWCCGVMVRHGRGGIVVGAVVVFHHADRQALTPAPATLRARARSEPLRAVAPARTRRVSARRRPSARPRGREGRLQIPTARYLARSKAIEPRRDRTRGSHGRRFAVARAGGARGSTCRLARVGAAAPSMSNRAASAACAGRVSAAMAEESPQQQGQGQGQGQGRGAGEGEGGGEGEG